MTQENNPAQPLPERAIKEIEESLKTKAAEKKGQMADPVFELEKQMAIFNRAIQDAQKANWNVSVHISPSTGVKTTKNPPTSGTAVYVKITRQFSGGTK